MKKQIGAVAASSLLIANTLFADASYTRTQTIKTGMTPQMTSMLKTFGGGDIAKALDPTTDVVMVHGNKMVTVTPRGSMIMDLDKQAWIQTDNAKHEYYVMTFQQMSDMMERFAKTEDSPPPIVGNAGANNPQIDSETTVDISEEHPGTTREIAGSTATEHIFKATITTKAKDATGKDPAVVTSKMFYTEEVWVVETVPAAYRQIEDFQKLMGEKAAKAMSPAVRNALPQGIPNTPGAANGMVDLQRRVAALKGLKAIEVTRLSMAVDAAPNSTAGAQQTTQTNGAQTTPAPAANSSSGSSAPASTSRFGGLGGALARGALGGFGAKKTAAPPPPAQDQTATTATQAQNTQAQNTQAQNNQAQNSQAQNQPAPASGAMPLLSETTVELGNFSTQPVAASVFEVPAGYKQVPSPLEKYMNSGK